MTAESSDRGEPGGPALGRSQRLLTRVMHLYFRFARGMTLGVRGAVLNDRGEVFLVRHGYTPGWHLPGGGVEVGETLEEALAKELREEGNVVVTGTPALHGVCFNRRASRRDHVAVYVVRDFSVTGVKAPDREIVEAGFFPLADLPEGTTPATRRRLAEIAGGLRCDPDW